VRASRVGLFAAAVALSLPACRALRRPPPDPAAARALPPAVVPPLHPGTPCARFFALGDTGTGGPGQRAVAAALAKKARRDGCDFVLLLGDNFYPRGVGSADDPRFERDFEQVYDRDALGVPFFAALGNHDHRGSIAAQIERTDRGTRWCMPGRHYSFTWRLEDGTALDFFAIDTTPIVEREEAGDAELEWIEGALARSQARWKIVFGHHPVRSAMRRGWLGPLSTALEPRLARGGADLYLAGHDHCLQMLGPRDGLACAIAGGGGGADNAAAVEWTDEVEYAATGGGFLAVRATADQLLLEFVRPDGRTQFVRALEKRGAPRRPRSRRLVAVR
jgi:acid phosphatase